jgi:hypothetical protein
VPTTGRPTGTSAVRKVEARDRAGSPPLLSSGQRHRRSHAEACDDDGPKRRSAPVSTARSPRAEDQPPPNQGAWSSYALPRVSPVSTDLKRERRVGANDGPTTLLRRSSVCPRCRAWMGTPRPRGSFRRPPRMRGWIDGRPLWLHRQCYPYLAELEPPSSDGTTEGRRR